MASSSVSINDISSTVPRLLGRTPDDKELRTFLSAIGNWPLPGFDPEEFTLYLEHKSEGFALLFEDSATVKHSKAAGKPARTPIFIGIFLYSQGIEGYQAFKSSLPSRVTWTDTPDTLAAKLGPPKNTINSKKTGALKGQRWAVDDLLLSVDYKNGTTVELVYLGIT